MKLSKVVASHGIPLGATKNGADWAMKALHPAEEGMIVGYPDGSVTSSMVVEYKNNYNITTAGANAWDADLILTGSPIDPMGVRTVDAVTLAATYTNCFNRMIENTVTSRLAALTAFGEQVEQYRCIAASATVHLNCTALTDSGTVVVSDYPWIHKELCLDTNSASHTGYTNFWIWPDQVKLFEQLQTLPHCYSGTAREGVYAPLKLTQFGWLNANDFHFHVNAGDSDAYTFPDLSLAIPAAGTSAADLPYGLESTETGMGQIIYEVPATSSIAHMSFKNLNNAATLTVIVRQVFEMRVTPGNMMAPMMKISPLLDMDAIKAYSMISRELCDAYPESYNSLGTLIKPIWSVVKSLGSVLFPNIGTFLSDVKDVATAASSVITSVSRNHANEAWRKRENKQKKLPAAKPRKRVVVKRR